jgi:sialate O-acetylesterase
MMQARTCFAAATLIWATVAVAEPRLSGVISDHAVIQRDRPITLTGTAQPGELVILTLAGHSVTATAGRDGTFRATLPALPAGGPYDITVAAPSGAHVVTDVLIGDVFLCSGQSNMEMAVRDAQDMIPAAQAPADPQLRLMTIAKTTAVEPQTRFAQPPAWTVAGPASVPTFSAACFYMVQALRGTTGVPIGAIHSSWGGSRISAWMSAPALRAGGLGTDADLLSLYGRDPNAANRRASTLWEAWWRDRSGDPVGGEPWLPGSVLDWRAVPRFGNFEAWGVPDLADYNGMVWFRRDVTLTARQSQGPAILAIGGIDDVDRTWVNGVGVGSTGLAGAQRIYSLPPGVLRPGRNVITVNVEDVYANGGMIGPAESMRLTLEDGTSISLGNGWSYAIAQQVEGSTPRVPWGDINGAGTLYNGMIAPLGSTQFAGIAWYQGESDTGIPGYDARLTELIRDWRMRFGTAKTAFAVVQLSAYGLPVSQPAESGWGRVRDAQRRVAAADPQGGLAVTHDIGDFTDIHPGQKYQVGLRLARAMRAALYGESIGRAGPEIHGAARMPDGGVALRFSGVTGALHARGAPVAIGFELCGDGAGSCRFAVGQVHADGVVLRSDGSPVSRVRYAWGDAPSTNLTDDARLPVGTFEIAVR